MLTEISLCEPADLRAALLHAFPETTSLQADQTDNGHLIAARAINAAAWAQLKRLASPQVTELEQIQRDLKAIAKHACAIVNNLAPQLTEADEINQVSRNVAVSLPLTPVVSAIESGARAGGFDAPADALKEAIKQVANLQLWAQAAAEAFTAGLSAREAAELRLRDDIARRSPAGAAFLAVTGDESLPASSRKRTHRPGTLPAHAGRDLGLVVMAVYETLAGRPMRVSRRNATKSTAGGEVTGPLVRFVIAMFEQIRLRLERDTTLAMFRSHRSFNPTPATIAAWTREYNLRVD